jgi:sec-independent protein translocase protein TatA
MTALFAIFGGPYDMLVILVIALLLFGNRLPSVMRSLGKGVTEFKKGIEGIEDEPAKKDEPKKIDEQPKGADQQPAKT